VLRIVAIYEQLGGGARRRKRGEQYSWFLDELPEFRRDVLESLRQPLEEGAVTIARAKRTLVFPARCRLVAAMNPCPCGYLTDPKGRCRCPPAKVAAYLSKLSGPLLDRIDLHVDVPAVPFDVIGRAPEGESSAQIRARVLKAQAWRRKRGQQHSNAQLRSKEHCQRILRLPGPRR